MTTKDQVRQVLDELPEDCTLEDVQYRLYVIEKVTRSLEAADRGEVISQDEMKQRVQSWLKR
jgi:hypothetical protein